MTYRIGKTSITLRETNRHKILKAIEKHETIIFRELLNLRIVSKGSLNIHLRSLIKSGEVEKFYNKTKNKLVYRLTKKGAAPLIIEGMIRNLGRVATHYIVRKKLNKPIDIHHDIRNEIKQYLSLKPKAVSCQWSWQ